MKVFAVAICGLVLLAGCYSIDAKPTAPNAFAQQARHSAEFISEISELAAKKAMRTDVRQMAITITVTQQNIATTWSLTANGQPALSPYEKRILEHLAAISGPDFDETYLQHLHQAYNAASELYASRSDPTSASILSILQRDLTHIRGLSSPLIG